MISEDSRHAAIKNNYSGDAGFFKAAIDIYMHDLIAKTANRRPAATEVLGRNGGSRDLRRRHRFVLREFWARSQTSASTTGIFQIMVLAGDGSAPRAASPTAVSARTKAIATIRRFPSIQTHLVEIKKIEKEMKESAATARQLV